MNNLNQAIFRPQHSTSNNFVTLSYHGENRLQGKTLCCCFEDFQKAFDIVPRSGFDRMIKVEMPLECRAFVA